MTEPAITPIPRLDYAPMFVMAVVKRIYHTQARQLFAKNINTADITLEMAFALCVIDAGEPMQQQRLADAILMDRSSAKRQVDNLVKRGLVITEKDPSNQRLKLLRLTDKGRSMVTAAGEIFRGFEAQFLSCLEDSEQAELLRLCRKLVVANRDEPVNPNV